MEISAKILADSISPQGKRVTTFELQYPRFIHSEQLTHHMFVLNASSSRAVPAKKMIEMVRTEPATPIHWGRNQPGMVANGELEEPHKIRAKSLWKEASDVAASISEKMHEAGAHKQILNRITEPFQWMKVILTGTEFNNYYWLRIAEDAQPEICALASTMKAAQDNNEPVLLYPGEWHLPYITTYRGEYSEWLDYIDPLSGESLSLETARTVSMARCAAVSYRTEDIGLEKAQDIYSKLFSGQKIHASPACHQATPMEDLPTITKKLEYMFETEGVTHLDRFGSLWSGNLQGWIQYRQLLPNHYKRG